MEPAEDGEEIAILRRSVGNARVAEQQRENRSESGPEKGGGEKGRDRRTVNLLHEHRDDELGARVIGCGTKSRQGTTPMTDRLMAR